MKRYLKIARAYKIVKSKDIEPGMVIDSDSVHSADITNSGNVYLEFESGDRANLDKEDKVKVQIK